MTKRPVVQVQKRPKWMSKMAGRSVKNCPENFYPLFQMLVKVVTRLLLVGLKPATSESLVSHLTKLSYYTIIISGNLDEITDIRTVFWPAEN